MGKLSDDVDSTLAQIATNTESDKNPGNSILYECVRTIMSIEKQTSLHVLAINILGRFLVNRDNNVRYVALNALCNAVTSNTDAIQRHRNTIVECLKDADLTIRKRSLDLIYALTNKKNIRSLARDLLNFLTISNTTTAFEVPTESPSPSKGDDDEKGKKSKKGKKKSRKERQREKEREEQRREREAALSKPKSDENGRPIFIEATSLSAGELEFRQELASKICMVVERYAPDRKWHIDTIIQVMATTTSTGFNREQEVISNLFILVSNTPDLQSYCTFKLYECLSKLELDSDPIRQITSWLIGEYGDKLLDNEECGEANEELAKDKRVLSEDDDDDDEMNNPHHGIERMTMDIGPFARKSVDEVVAMLQFIVKHDKSSETTKGFGLTALMKIRHKYQLQNIDRDVEIMDILEQFRDDKQIEVQQRSVEFVSLFESTDQEARRKILKAMPVPKIERLFDERTKAEKKMDPDDQGTDTDTSSEEPTESDSEPSDSEVEDSDSSDSSSEKSKSESDDDDLDSDSDDSKTTRKRKRKERKKRDKERAKKAKQKAKEEEEKKRKKAEKKKKKKEKSQDVVIPKLSGPDDAPNGGDFSFASPPEANGNSNMMNGNQKPKAAPAPSNDLLNFPSNPATTTSNGGGGGMDFL